MKQWCPWNRDRRSNSRKLFCRWSSGRAGRKKSFEDKMRKWAQRRYAPNRTPLVMEDTAETAILRFIIKRTQTHVVPSSVRVDKVAPTAETILISSIRWYPGTPTCTYSGSLVVRTDGSSRKVVSGERASDHLPQPFLGDMCTCGRMRLTYERQAPVLPRDEPVFQLELFI